jgi:hypothetical protein
MSNFIYLIQSDTDELMYDIPGGSDYLLLKWSDGATMRPNTFQFASTFAEGRNELYRRARERGDYLYYVYMDDDVEFVNFDLHDFEAAILERRIHPPYAFPYLQGHNFYLHTPRKGATLMKYADHPLMAVRSDIAAEMPYTLKYDKVCWWRTTAEWNERFVEKYGVGGLCFGWLEIENGQHRDAYPRDDFNDYDAYTQIVIPTDGRLRAGDARIFHEWGDRYLNGENIEKDESKAVHYWQKGAKLGSIQCCRNLVWAFTDGVGVDPDAGKAAYWQSREEYWTKMKMDELR